MTKPRADVNRDYFKNRAMAGDKRVTVWLSKDAREALARLKLEYGSNDKAAEHAILDLDRRSQSGSE